MKEIRDWENDYHIEISEYPKGYGSWNVVSKEEFKNVLLDSEIENMNTRKIVQLVNSI